MSSDYLRHCPTCDWWGYESETSKRTDDMSADNSGDLVDMYDCPKCGCETEPDDGTMESHLAMKGAGLL